MKLKMPKYRIPVAVAVDVKEEKPVDYELMKRKLHLKHKNKLIKDGLSAEMAEIESTKYHNLIEELRVLKVHKIIDDYGHRFKYLNDSDKERPFDHTIGVFRFYITKGKKVCLIGQDRTYEFIIGLTYGHDCISHFSYLPNVLHGSLLNIDEVVNCFFSLIDPI